MRAPIARLGAVTLLAGAGLVGPTGAPAHAAECSGAEGVTVVVQQGDSSTTRCATGDPGSASAALADAGFSVEQVQTQPGAICTIDSLPSTSCVQMPPADRYWAFYHAPAGDSWTFSQTSASQHDPEPGDSVGFRLGDGSAKPSAAPATPAPSASSGTSGTSGTSDASREPTTSAQEGSGDDDRGLVPGIAVGGGLLALLGGGALLAARRREL